ncbi:MAG: hypothetical protein ACFFBL_06215 [Promethearchaeota archaeon]
MTEIPMADAGATAGPRPKEVTQAGYLLLLAAITGLIVGTVEYLIWEDELALLGVVLAVVAFWLYTQVLKQDYSAWLMSVIFNIIAIFLYATGSNWPGVALSIIVLLYFINPSTKVHFENR